MLATLDATDVPADWFQADRNVPQPVKLDASAWSSALLSKPSLKKFVQLSQEADLVHLHTPWDLANVQLASALRATEVPYMVTIHGMLDDYSMRLKPLKKRFYLALFEERLFQHAAAVHFTAEAERDQALPWIPGDYLPVIQACAMDLTPYDNLPGPELALKAFPEILPERKKILFLSRVHPKKGLELLLEAGRILRDRQTPIQLLIAGPGEEGYLSQLRALSQRCGLNGDTHFLGMVRGAEKLSLYQLADVFVLPTYQENFGLVLPEAMATGTPVVTTRGTDIWRELQQGGAKIVDFSPSSIADAIADLLSDETRRREIGRQGQTFVRQWLNVENVAAGYERMYRDAVQWNQRTRAE